MSTSDPNTQNPPTGQTQTQNPPAAATQPPATQTTSPDGKTIKVEIGRNAEVESLRKELEEKNKLLTKTEEDRKKLEGEKTTLSTELDEKKGIIANQALQEFEKERQTILDMVKGSKLTEDQVKEIEEKLKSPNNLELVKKLIIMMIPYAKPEAQQVQQPAQQQAPQGRAPPAANLNIDPKSEQFPDKVAMVDAYYDRAYYHPDKYAKEVVEDAKAKINTLFGSLINGKSWQQLKDGDAKTLSKAFSLVSCPKCHRTFVDEVPDKCPQCGFNMAKTGNSGNFGKDDMRGR